VAEPALSFAELLRQFRAAAQLTQEELAQAAGLSPRSVSDLERGINRTARKDTAVLLADALGLPGQLRVLFVAAARGRAPAAAVLAARPDGVTSGPVVAATRSLPRDIGSFTGREPELAQLLGSLAGPAPGGGVPGICVVDGMAGIGKTSLVVHAAHRLAGSFPDGQFFLALYAHTPGQRPVTPADALASLLLTAGVAEQHIPPGLAARAARWRDHIAGHRILLVLDDAAGHEQVRPLLPGTAGSQVLVTSRRRLTALEDAAVISLGTLSPAESVALLARLAGRPDLAAAPDAAAPPGPATGPGPAEQITRLCGYLPLAIGMLARQLRHHPARTGAELAASLAAARDRLAVMQAENLSVAAAFDLSYQDLTAGQQRLFRRLGVAPGPDIDAYAAAALDGTSLDHARAQLDELYDHHLLTEPAAGRYLLHDLLREYARGLAAAGDTAAGAAAAARLVSYYAHVAVAAGRHIATWTTVGGRRPPPGPPPASAPPVASPEQAAAWLEAERANLHAAVEYAAATAMPGHAIAIAAAMGGFLRARGHWAQAAGQYRTALSAARQAGDRLGQAGVLDELGLLQELAGDYRAATASLIEAIELFRDLGDLPGQVYARNHLGLAQMETGDFPAAAASHRQALALARRAGDPLAEAVSLSDLGLVQQLTGDYPASVAGLERALALFRRVGAKFDEADVLAELGWVYERGGDYGAAAAAGQQALALFGSLGDRLGQARALDVLGLVQQRTGDYPGAARSAAQAIELFRDLGSRHDLAMALISLGDLSLRTAASEQARGQYGEALAIARAAGTRLEEARALEGIGRSALDRDPGDAAAHLRQALEIYQDVGVPDAQRVQDTLRERGL